MFLTIFQLFMLVHVDELRHQSPLLNVDEPGVPQIKVKTTSGL